MSSSSRRFVNASATGPRWSPASYPFVRGEVLMLGSDVAGAVVVIPSRTTTAGIVEYRGASGWRTARGACCDPAARGRAAAEGGGWVRMLSRDDYVLINADLRATEHS